jgi:LysE type translocator/HxlR-like helix-turn-helix
MLAALGFNLGGYVHLTAAVLGLSAILATSSVAFTVVKWLGAGYLIYLGIRALRSNQGPLVIIVDGLASRMVGRLFGRHFSAMYSMPPKVEYTLSDLGRSLLPVISVMHKWGVQHLVRPSALRRMGVLQRA